MRLCDSCTTPPTPLDDVGRCVTCDAASEGLVTLTRSGFAAVKEMFAQLEDGGVSAEMERVPAARPEEKHHPLWNLYVARDEVPQAHELLRSRWASQLDHPDAAEAAARGQQGIDLDAGGEITCPACGHGFAVTGGGEVECPDCGLGLGAPEPAPSGCRKG